MHVNNCPEEHELLAVALGESRNRVLLLHIARCDTCGKRVQRLRKEVALLREAHRVRRNGTPKRWR